MLTPSRLWARIPVLAASSLAALSLALAGGASAQTVGGTADVGLGQEPACLNPYLACGLLMSAQQISALALPGAFRVRPDLTREPVLVQSVDVRKSTLTYHLKSSAEWSDGVPVSADDLVFTFQTIMNPANQIASRAGYDLITQAVKVGPKSVRFVFSRPYAAWMSLFPNLLPKHVLEGHDFDSVWSTGAVGIGDPETGVPIGSGPFLTTGWFPGDRIEMSRNANWWGPHAPYLDGVVFRFILNSADRVAALTAGAVDLLHEFPQLTFEPLFTAPGIVASWHPGTGLEHLDFQTASTTMPLLQQRWFREAVAYAIDRDATVSDLYAPLTPGGLDPTQSLLYLSQQAEYRPHFARYEYNPSTVASIMTSHGCVMGLDGIWSCDGVRASLDYFTTTGNQIRAQVFEAFQEQAAAAGIELVPHFQAAGTLFGTTLPSGAWHLMAFTWVRTGEPFGLDETYGCAGDNNNTGYCSPATTWLLAASNSELSPSYRASLVNRAGTQLASALMSVPLYQAPRILAYRTQLHGVVADSGPQGATWNAEEWYLEP